MRVCTGCGYAFREDDNEKRGQYCPRCGTPLETKGGAAQEDGRIADETAPSTGPISDRPFESHTLRFTGSACEYLRIWAVNACLTILTLGIYAAWAKIRTRQYFYVNTRLAGHPFYFLGQPTAILKGNIIIGIAFIIYCIAKGVDPVWASAVASVFYLAVPYLIYKSLRFNARYSSFRNIRFGFRGSAAESYYTYLLFPSLIPFTLGLILPYWEFRRKKYFFDNLMFGASVTAFTGRPGYFYRTYVKAALIPIAVVFFLGIAAAVMIPMLGRLAPMRTSIPGWTPMIIPVVVFSFLFLIGTMVQQALYADLTNYCWGKTTLGNMRFVSTLRAWPLIWIRFSNIIAVVFSLGLLFPWAKVRRFRYLTEHLTVLSNEELDAFSASAEREEGSLGDAATDFFDIGFGL